MFAVPLQKVEAGFLHSRKDSTAGERLDVYIGEVFATEQKALSVKDTEPHAPTF